jgi:hypothetical protein
MAMANGSYVPMEVEVGESDKKAKPWQSFSEEPKNILALSDAF